MANQLHYVFDEKNPTVPHVFLSLSQDQLNLTDDCFDESTYDQSKNILFDAA